MEMPTNPLQSEGYQATFDAFSRRDKAFHHLLNIYGLIPVTECGSALFGASVMFVAHGKDSGYFILEFFQLWE
jgi:hypothetical protein